MPYTGGFWLIYALIAACYPDDLDALDESVPFAKTVMDRLLGIDHTGEFYKYKLDCLIQAQSAKKWKSRDCLVCAIKTRFLLR